MKNLMMPFDITNQKQNNDNIKKDFENFEAVSLFCPRCKQAVPVIKKLLLILPQGEQYEYLCAYCSSTVGDKIEKGNNM